MIVLRRWRERSNDLAARARGITFDAARRTSRSAPLEGIIRYR
jgi:hypothetical protein